MAPESVRRYRSVLSAALALAGALLLGLSLLAGAATAAPPPDHSDNGQASSHSSSGTSGTAGDPSSPQPQSTADTNNGGANGQCPGGTYCSTRHGAKSQNGNGGGKATGKPCAGCVGKADNKNPPGQETSSPGTTFPNNGYECDNNNGIGKTNPAHTGCTSTPSTSTSLAPTPDCTTNPPPAGCPHHGDTSCTSANGCTSPGNTTVTGSTTGGAMVLGESLSKLPTNVLGERVPTVAGRQLTRTPSALPFTGFETAVMLAVGAVAALAGALLWTAGTAGGLRRSRG